MKKARQKLIRELIEEHDIETQEELAAHLERAGFSVTQTTISRDIREMRISKLPSGNGKQRYVDCGRENIYLGDKYIRVLRDGFASMDMAQNILVVKTVPGLAMAVAAALDAMRFPEIVGCIAGDDTIMVAVRTVEDTELLMGKINGLLDK